MKRLSILLFAMIIIATFVGCSNEKIKNDADNIEVEKAPEYSGENFEEFLDYLQDQLTMQNGNVDDYSVNGSSLQIAYVTVPILQSNDFVFHSVEENEYSYFYYYEPVGTLPDDYFDYTTGVIVSVSKSDQSYAAVVDQLGLTPTDGIAYHQEDNTWYINDNGFRIYISFPKNLIVQNAESLSEYFTFKKIFSKNEDNTVTDK